VFSEDLLQFIWQHQFLEKIDELQTIEGESVQVIHSGRLNIDGGPDFLNAQIQIGSTKWAGNVELHLKSSDWMKHKHDDNPAYNKLILHVVYEHDTFVELNFPTLEIKNHIRPTLLERYEELMRIDKEIPCQSLLKDIGKLRKTHMLERVLIERLERKTQDVKTLLAQTNQHWEEVFYILVARNFGLKINQEPFQKIAENTPSKLFAKHKNNLRQIEAILFGQAGFLQQEHNDAYFIELLKEYSFLQKLYSLKNIPLHRINFLRLRPANFPTIRLAQFSKLLHQSSHLLSKVLETSELKKVITFFDVEASEYWDNHYTFGKVSDQIIKKKLGKNFIELLMINTVIPLLFIYGKEKGENQFCNRAMSWLEELKPEKNSITKTMHSIGFELENAKDSQALLELKTNYCDSKQCLQCRIGYAIMN